VLDATIGDRVQKGQTVAVLEAMKMEHQLVAEIDGVVTDLAKTPGAQVKIRQLLVTIAPEADHNEGNADADA
jgi:geranyl-CoA carboxylase alpha subunit